MLYLINEVSQFLIVIIVKSAKTEQVTKSIVPWQSFFHN